MIQPGRYDIFADRWVACVRTFSFVGFDFTGSTFASHIRLTPDATGAALVTLGNAASASAEGIRVIAVATATVAQHIANGWLTVPPPHYVLTDTVTITQIGMRINETTVEGLPFPAERGNDNWLAWDLHITPVGKDKDKYLGGDFVVRAGATQ
jgi:hypothetical protein